MKKILCLLLLMILNLGFALADNMAPFVSLTARDIGTGIEIKVAAYDEPLLNTNPGIRWVGIYENDILIFESCPRANLLCSGTNPSIYSLVRSYSALSSSTLTYYAKAEDISRTESINETSNKPVTIKLVPLIVDGPDVTYIDQTSATIDWDTNRNSDDVVRYGTVKGLYYSPLAASNSGTSHSITLTRLSGQTYYYIIESTDVSNRSNIGISEEYSFSMPDLTPPVISNIVIENVGLTGIKIKWNTNEDSDSAVRYGITSGSYTLQEANTNLVKVHEILLNNLTDGQTYYYIVESTDNAGNPPAKSAEGSFTTGLLEINFNEPDDGEEFLVGKTIEGELEIKNNNINDVDIDVEIVFYDETEDDEIKTLEFENKDLEAGESEDIEFEIEIPFNLDEGHDYTLYAEISADGVEYKKEISIDIDRKSSDVVIENLRVNVLGEKVEVFVDVLNKGKKDQETSIEMIVQDLGISLVSDTFVLEDWESSLNRITKKFTFEKPSEGTYSVEAAVHYGTDTVYERKDFTVGSSSGAGSSSKLITGNIGSSTITSESKDSLLNLENTTWILVDFLLLTVVIYGFVWLIGAV